MELFFPESNHNDWIPLMTDRRMGEYRVILLRTISDNKLMKKRMEVVESMLKQRMDVFAIQSTSDNPLNALLEYTVIGDWASYYTALLDAIDPSPVAPIEELKKRLKEK
jgi:Bacterial phospho-glucose isomerase C-terminal region.